MDQISYFLFYPCRGTAGSMPQPFSIRVRHHGPPCGFNVTTRSKGLPLVPLQTAQAARILRLLWPISREAQPLGWTAYESFTLRVESIHWLGHPTKWVAPWERSVPMESLDTPRSAHVASHEELQGIDHTTWSLMLPLWPLVSGNPTVPIPSMRPLVFSTL